MYTVEQLRDPWNITVDNTKHSKNTALSASVEIYSKHRIPSYEPNSQGAYLVGCQSPVVGDFWTLTPRRNHLSGIVEPVLRRQVAGQAAGAGD